MKGSCQNTGVKDDTHKQFLSLSPIKSLDERSGAFNDKLKESHHSQKVDVTIKVKLPAITMKYDDVADKEWLAIKIEEPTVSEREKYLLQLA